MSLWSYYTVRDLGVGLLGERLGKLGNGLVQVRDETDIGNLKNAERRQENESVRLVYETMEVEQRPDRD